MPIPDHVHPSKNAGLELTGPWHPLDMAFNALNSPAPMNMPDFEDAAPPHFQPDGTPTTEPVGVFAAMQNAKEIHEGRWNTRAYEVTKKGKKREYRITASPDRWPTRLARPPSLHILYDHVLVDGMPAPGLVVMTTLWAMNNLDALRRSGSGVYFYIPKLQTPREALVVESLLSRLEGLAGVAAGTFKIKMLYEEGNAGRQLPAILWVLRRRLLGTNVGRWDYLGSLIEMWKDDPRGVFPDPQSIGMATPNMIAYQRYNALLMLMAGLKDGELTNGAPIGGMAAVMIYQAGDPYGRSRYNAHALRAIVLDKLRERVLGLVFVPDAPLPAGAAPTLEDVLETRVKGKLYDLYRQSWVASPELDYVAAGNAPLRAPVTSLQAILDAPRETVDVKGKPVPSVASGLTDAERELLRGRGLLDARGKITPWVVSRESLDAPEKLLDRARWEAIYLPPKGDVTIEHVQHSFYMAANYGFQILNGNFAAAIDDYELKLRFMNDLATYRINVSWLWTLARHEAPITRDGSPADADPHRGRGRARRARRAGEGGDPLRPRALRQGLGLPRRVDAGVLRRAGPARRPGALRPLQGGRHHGAAPPAAPLAALHPAQRPGALRRRPGERGRARRAARGDLRSRARRDREARPGGEAPEERARGARLRERRGGAAGIAADRGTRRPHVEVDVVVEVVVSFDLELDPVHPERTWGRGPRCPFTLSVAPPQAARSRRAQAARSRRADGSTYGVYERFRRGRCPERGSSDPSLRAYSRDRAPYDVRAQKRSRRGTSARATSRAAATDGGCGAAGDWNRWRSVTRSVHPGSVL